MHSLKEPIDETKKKKSDIYTIEIYKIKLKAVDQIVTFYLITICLVLLDLIFLSLIEFGDGLIGFLPQNTTFGGIIIWWI